MPGYSFRKQFNCAGGAIARKLLEKRGVQVVAYTKEIGGIACQTFDEQAIEQNAVRACDTEAATIMIERVEQLAVIGDSCGGIVECRIRGVIPGLGEPIFDKLDAELAKAMLYWGCERYRVWCWISSRFYAWQ